jgi:isocitrate dehydrogenase (NAD+)
MPQRCDAVKVIMFFNLQGRSIMTYVPLPGDGRPHVVTLIPGDGIGPEVTDVVTKVVDVLGAPLVWERCG